LCESISSELHPIAGIAGETDDDSVELLDLFGHRILISLPYA
jgi:hypothetical protein